MTPFGQMQLPFFGAQTPMMAPAWRQMMMQGLAGGGLLGGQGAPGAMQGLLSQGQDWYQVPQAQPRPPLNLAPTPAPAAAASPAGGGLLGDVQGPIAAARAAGIPSGNLHRMPNMIDDKGRPVYWRETAGSA